MPQFTLNQAARSLKLATMLVLNELDPESQSGGYGAVDSLDRDGNGRVSFTYEDQTLPSTHGPNGAAAVPGIVVEYGPADEVGYNRFQMPVVLSVARLVQGSVERENEFLERLCSLLHSFVYVTQTCPVYQFTTEDDDYATGTVGRISWYERYGNGRPSAETIGEVEKGGWLRKEYHFTVCFSCKP